MQQILSQLQRTVDMKNQKRIDWESLESTGAFEKRFPGLIKMKFKDILDFKSTYPPEYNLYYPPGVEHSKNYDIVLRILPEASSKIYSGEKPYELRKYVPKHTGLVFLLETNKREEYTGCFFFQKFIVEEINALWNLVGEKAAPKQIFDSYFRDKKYGVALEIDDFERFTKPIPFEQVYDQCRDMPRPPHPYVYLYTQVGSKLSNLLRDRASRIIGRNEL